MSRRFPDSSAAPLKGESSPTYPPLFADPSLQERLDSEGFVVVDAFEERDVALLRLRCERMCAGWNGSGVFTSVLALARNENYAFDAELKMLAAPIVSALAPSADLHGASFLVKGACGDTAFVLHQDWNNVDESQHMSYALWAPLVDTDGTSGGLCVLPGSHRVASGRLRSPTHPSTSFLFDERVAALVQYLRVRAGQACVFAHSLFHGSLPNTSGAPRPVIHAGLFPRNAQQVHYFAQGDTIEELAVDRDFYYAHMATVLAGAKPPDSRVLRTLERPAPHPADDEALLQAVEALARRGSRATS